MAERASFVKKERLCIVCLQTHAVGKCFSKRKCFTCGGSHNSIICESKKKPVLNALCGISEAEEIQLIPKLLIHVNDIRRSAIAIVDSGANLNIVSQTYCTI